MSDLEKVHRPSHPPDSRTPVQPEQNPNLFFPDEIKPKLGMCGKGRGTYGHRILNMLSWKDS